MTTWRSAAPAYSAAGRSPGWRYPCPTPSPPPKGWRSCDDTRELALSESGQEVKVKHSRNSHAQLGPARQALAMVHTLADDFAAQEVAKLCRVEVTPSQWKAFLDAHIPRVHTTTGLPLAGRSQTMADTKRDGLTTLYRADPRVSPWTGTAHGVLQAVNTYEHHEGVVRGERANATA